MKTEVIAPRGRLFSSHEAAAYLGMPMKRLRRLIEAQKIPVIRDGRLGFYERDLDDWVERHRTEAVEPQRQPAQRRAVASPDAPQDISCFMPRTRRLSRANGPQLTARASTR